MYISQANQDLALSSAFLAARRKAAQRGADAEATGPAPAAPPWRPTPAAALGLAAAMGLVAAATGSWRRPDPPPSSANSPGAAGRGPRARRWARCGALAGAAAAAAAGIRAGISRAREPRAPAPPG